MTEENKKTHKEIIEAETMAALATLSHRVSHEISNALMGTMLLVECFKAEKGISNEEHKILGHIEQGLKRIADISAKLKAFPKGKELPLEKININDVIKNAVSSISKEFKASGVDLKEYYGADLPDTAVSKNEILYVLISMLLNAKDAVLEKSSKQIAISSYLEDNKVKIKVKDNGCGIKQDDANKIFSPLFTTKLVSQGLGINLSIAKAIMESHNGKIEFNSESQKGAEFILCLPALS
jgi:C4-dicarboxylate-specific signal transduction histidine kinase